jgi:hypothetical protein
VLRRAANEKRGGSEPLTPRLSRGTLPRDASGSQGSVTGERS